VKCQPLQCDENAYCGRGGDEAEYGCHCFDGYSGDGLECTLEYSECVAWGDPHYITFDDRKYNFQGTCKYMLVTPNCTTTNVDQPYFSVVAQNRKNKPSDRVSYTREVYVDVAGKTFELLQGGDVHVDGMAVTLPYHLDGSSDVVVKRTGRFVKLLTSFGLIVLWDTKSSVTIQVPHTYLNGTCGLCGTLDKDMDNDLMNPEGNVLNSEVEFGNSWAVNADECDGTTDDPDPCENLSPDELAAIEDSCSILTDTSGVFAGCHDHVDQQHFYDTCVYDSCAVPGNESLCENLENYAKKCMEAGGDLSEWRRDDLCRKLKYNTLLNHGRVW